MFTVQGFIRVAILATLLIASAARAEESAVSGSKVTNDLQGERQLEIAAWRGVNKLEVDDEASQKIDYRSYGAQLHYAPRPFTLDLAATALDRDVEDLRMGGNSSKSTQIVTPAVGVWITRRVQAKISHSAIQTLVDNELTDEAYRLDTDRQALTVLWRGDDQEASLTYATEARAEKSYEAGVAPYAFTAVDRDYVPAQVDLAYAQRVTPPLEVSGKMRYSQYNNDVYKDQYDSDVPKAPTLAQVFDYLLSFEAGAAYAVTPTIELTTSFERKAALDTNSFTGDEYLVSTGATVGGRGRVSDAATVGLGATTATGAKTHEVQGVSYEYANRTTRYEASIALSM